MVRRRPELLAPAGDLEKLKMAVVYGADAVYLAGKDFGLRAYAGNFTRDQMRKGVEFAAGHGVKVYVTVNIFPHNADLAQLPEYLTDLAELGVNGLIVADPGVVNLVLKHVPQLPVHLSTQANTTNYASADFWFSLGVKRIVLARELSIQEIQEIRNKVAGELEIFVHGAMCMSYSGRCLLSNYLAGRDANRGECAQPCRWGYALAEEKRPGQYFPLEEDTRGTYIFNSYDLSLLEHIPELVELGLDSFKIEGRMKSVNYVATVVKAYRQALDAYLADPDGYRFDPGLAQEIVKVSHRDYSTGFLFGRPGAEAHNLVTSGYRREYDFVGVVKAYDSGRGMALVEQRNKFSVGDKLEFTGPNTEPLGQSPEKMYDEGFAAIEAAPHAQQQVWIPVDAPVEVYSLVRRERSVATVS
ncbi:MAG TPA: U32 family peptidase [Desulfobacteria bacterium]|nr:U32 family peptidase [Desulfobacteria bacterium]